MLLFSGIYIKYYTSKTESEWSTTISAVVALSITLLTTALIPVDVFLVSFMKNSDGSFKDWASLNSTRNSLEQSVATGYYSKKSYSLPALLYYNLNVRQHDECADTDTIV